jgi:hypothetical protein
MTMFLPERISETSDLAFLKAVWTSSKELTPSKATLTAYVGKQWILSFAGPVDCQICTQRLTLGLRGVRIETPVMIPRDPSDPMNSCFKSYPVLSLRKVDRFSRIVPSGSTTSNPRTVPCNEPYRSKRRPPALVATFPPMWQLLRISKFPFLAFRIIATWKVPILACLWHQGQWAWCIPCHADNYPSSPKRIQSH